jgi:hypothetical protein
MHANHVLVISRVSKTGPKRNGPRPSRPGRFGISDTSAMRCRVRWHPRWAPCIARDSQSMTRSVV